MKLFGGSITKYGRLFVGAEVVVGEVKVHAQLLREEGDKRLVVLVSHQSVGEDTEALVHPQPRHGVLGVVIVPVSS